MRVLPPSQTHPASYSSKTTANHTLAICLNGSTNYENKVIPKYASMTGLFSFYLNIALLQSTSLTMGPD